MSEIKPIRKTKKVRSITSLTDRQAESLKSIPESQKGMFEKAYTNKSSAGQLIKAKCLECCVNSREEVSLCNISSCPLWRRRPFQKL